MSPSIGPTDARPGALLAAILLGFRPLSRVRIEQCEIVCRDGDNLRLCTCSTLAFWTYFFGSIAAGRGAQARDSERAQDPGGSPGGVQGVQAQGPGGGRRGHEGAGT